MLDSELSLIFEVILFCLSGNNFIYFLFFAFYLHFKAFPELSYEKPMKNSNKILYISSYRPKY